MDESVPGFLGRVLDSRSGSLGTCFQVAPAVMVTAWRVLDDAGGGHVGAPVWLDPLAGGGAIAGRTVRVDALRDLAVIRADRPFPASATRFVATDTIAALTSVLVTGAAHIDRFRSAASPGTWLGGATREDRVALGRLQCALTAGMSGAPVLRRVDDAVVGVVSARYNDADGWPHGWGWVTRVEDLLPMLDGLIDARDLGVRVDLGGVAVTLSVDGLRTRLLAPGVELDQPHRGAFGLATRQADRLRWQRRPAARDLEPAAPPPTAAGVGRLLAEAFLPPPIDGRLAELLRQAAAGHAPVRLGLRVAGDLARLPWETLQLPGTDRSAALHDLTRAYRQVDAFPVTPSAGPLRILVAISSPLSGGGGVLDYERELRNVLAAVRAARASRAQVRIVHFATTTAIREALEETPVHVLHLSGHGRPGQVELEDEDGAARPVTAGQFSDEAVPPGRMPAVIALAACHTNVSTVAGELSFAEGLIRRGAGVVIATETSITDVYATRVFARVYGQLAAERDTDVVAAVAQARAAVHRELLASPDDSDQRLAASDEWSVLTVLAGAGRVPLVDPALPPLPGPDPASSARGVLRRDVGEVVGRRREQRRWPVELLSPGAVGIVVHGIGGVGKTTLADELCARVAEREPDRVTVTVIGQCGGGQLLDALSTALLRTVPATQPFAAMRHALRQVGDGTLSLAERIATLQRSVLSTVPVLLVLDNFEDNLSLDDRGAVPTVQDDQLAGVLAGLAISPGRLRLLITSRYRFTLPGSVERVLSFRQLGPLSEAETQKLAWALTGLDRLDEAELRQVWRTVGGHPRCLEYVDALLNGAGRGRFADVTMRLADAVRRRLLGQNADIDVDSYFATHATLAVALAEVATLAADDVLLDDLLDGLAGLAGAHRLLLGASVYRRPVDDAALAFQIDDPDDGSDPAAARRRLVDACASVSLITYDPAGATTFVHRWTAADLARRWIASGRTAELVDAHRRAAAYWHWRVRTRAQPATDDVDDLREAHHHFGVAADLGDGQSLVDRASAARTLQRRLGHLGRRHEALNVSDEAVSLVRAFAAAEPDRFRRDLAMTLAEHATRLTDVGRDAEAVTVGQEVVSRYRELVGAESDAVEPGLVLSMSNLSLALSRMGRRHEALATATEAAAMYRRLTLADLVDEPDLALALMNLAGPLADMGERVQALAITREALDLYRQLVEIDPQRFEPDLALTLNNLSLDLSRLGHRQEALARATEVVAIFRRLRPASPGRIGPDLAMALNNLGARLSDLGRWAEALAATEEAVAIRRGLVQDNPGAFEPDLVSALNNLSVDLASLGRPEEAVAVVEEAVAMYRGLVAVNPGGFEAHLAVALGSLGNHLSDLGRRTEALTASTEAVTVYRRLVATNRAFEPDLADSLNNLAIRLSDLDRADETLAAEAEAAAIYRRLASANPGAFEPDLATLLTNLSGSLSKAQRPAEALAAAEEGAGIFRRLVLADPGAFEPRLTGALNSLANRLADAGRHIEALAVTTEAVTVQRRLAAANPGHEPTLAVLLMSLGNRLAELSRPQESVAATREAIAVYRRLDATNSDRFQANLADALCNLSSDLTNLGLPEDALAAEAEAVGHYRQLVAANPGLFEAALARVLRSTSMTLSSLGRGPAALTAAEEAVARYRQLVQEVPGRYEAKLEIALDSLSRRLAELGRHDEAHGGRGADATGVQLSDGFGG